MTNEITTAYESIDLCSCFDILHFPPEEFLEECMAAEVRSLKEVRRYLDESGADVEGLSDRELEESAEVFALPSGGYLIVEG